jgi:DNA-binding ferritin-like protein
MLNNHTDRIERIIKAGERAVEELIKVLHSEIITDDPDKDVAADRLKNAAATKKMALNDAFDMLNRIEQEKGKLEGNDEPEEKSFQSFAERRGRKS